MIDIKNITYEVLLVMEDGKNLDLTGAAEDLGWEENKGELAMRINLSIANTTFNGKNISSLAKPGCLIGIIANWGGGSGEVARGTIVDWETNTSNSKNSFNVVCYDDLYNLQKSQDNIYYEAGIGTKSAITGIFDNWGVDIEKYEGPNETHAKLVYKTEALSDVILDILDDAEKKGAERCFIRSHKGRISILPKGSNDTVYHFGEDNTVISSNKQSTANLVTRVKVIGKEDDDGKSSVEATENGKTEFGIRQRILVNPKDDSLEETKKTAKEILFEQGDIEKVVTVQSPDVPAVRKGDLVHVIAGTLNGYYYVEGIRHDAANCMMTMDLENAKEADEKATARTDLHKDGDFNEGDTVILNGAVYVDSFGNGKGQTFSNRTCKITIKVDTSRPCPYHVDGIGWVYPSTITKV